MLIINEASIFKIVYDYSQAIAWGFKKPPIKVSKFWTINVYTRVGDNYTIPDVGCVTIFRNDGIKEEDIKVQFLIARWLQVNQWILGNPQNIKYFLWKKNHSLSKNNLITDSGYEKLGSIWKTMSKTKE